LLLKQVKDRLLERNIKLEIGDAVYEKIAKEGFSEEYGARNLRRKIQELIENSVSDLLIKEHKKISKIKVGMKGKKLTFSSK
jgi:ATP-dependent Clp protease ATP-binding subunit ClpC